MGAAALASTPFHQKWLVEWLRGNPPYNVWFGVSVEDQERAEERVSVLQQIPARIRWLSAEPLLSPIDLNYSAFNGADSITRIPDVHWVVVGGESGPKARPCNAGWIEDIVGKCKGAGVPVFVKQLGSDARCSKSDHTGYRLDPATGIANPMLITQDRAGADPSEWPADLRVREFPR